MREILCPHCLNFVKADLETCPNCYEFIHLDTWEVKG